MRRAFFFIVAVCLATSSFASIPRASALDLSSPSFDALSETRIRVSEDLAPFESPAPSLLSRALRQGYERASTTNASGLAGFLSVDPVLDVKSAVSHPQSWNRYAYVENNPINRNDPDGKCSDPSPGGGGARICIQQFIPTPTFGVFVGDGRGPRADGGTYRVSQTFTLTPGGHGAVGGGDFHAGVSKVVGLGDAVGGPFRREAAVAQSEVRGTPQGVNVQMKASDGVFRGGAPNIRLDLTISPTAGGGTKVEGTHSAYPAVEVWRYSDGSKPQLLYQYMPKQQDLAGGTKAIFDTVTVPGTQQQ